jgi:hemoglobin/transferrin/lactoferrin receptor protein
MPPRGARVQDRSDERGDLVRLGTGYWSWAVLAAVVAAPAAASEATDAADAERGAAAIFDQLTVVGSKVEERVGEIAGSATVISRAELDYRQAQRLDDLVRHEPGVSATGAAGRFGFAAFRVRGIDGNRVAVELDGVPAPDAFAVGSFASAGRGFVQPELLRSVEILRGPASALHGSDALGGVVVLTTRAPAEFLGAEPDAAGGFAVGADGRDAGLRASALGAASRGRWQALALLAGRRGEELDNRGDVAPDPATSEELGAFARLVRLLDDGLLELTVDRHEAAVATAVDHLERGPGQFATTVALDADDRLARSRVALLHTFATASPALREGRTRLSWSDVSTVQTTWQERAADPRTPSPTRRWRQFELAEKRIDGEWTGRSELAAGGVIHRLVWGVEAGLAEIHERRDGTETDLATGAVTRVVLGERLPVRDFPLSRRRSLAVFLADDVVLGARWRLQPALRWERTATDARPDALYRDDFPDTPVVDSDDSSWTPKLGVTYALGRGHSAYAQYAEGFRAAPFHDVNVGLKIATFNYEAIPNPDLRPERSRGVELGWRYAGAAWSAQLAAYDNRYRDLIESRANLGRDPQSGATIFQSVNRDRARIRGIEGRLRVELVRLAPAARGWTLDAGLAWADGEDTRRGQPLNSVDPAKTTLAAAYSTPDGRWGASAVGTWADGKRSEVDTTAANVFAPPGYALLDLYGEWRPRPRWTLSIALLNALDEKYWVFGRVRGVLADDPQVDFHSEPGRALLVGVAWRR